MSKNVVKKSFHMSQGFFKKIREKSTNIPQRSPTIICVPRSSTWPKTRKWLIVLGQTWTISVIVNAPTLHKKASKEVLGISLLQNSTESTTIPTGPSVFHTTTYIVPTVQCSVGWQCSLLCWCQARPFSCPSHL